jgi:hypothetical protein
VRGNNGRRRSNAAIVDADGRSADYSLRLRAELLLRDPRVSARGSRGLGQGPVQVFAHVLNRFHHSLLGDAESLLRDRIDGLARGDNVPAGDSLEDLSGADR